MTFNSLSPRSTCEISHVFISADSSGGPTPVDGLVTLVHLDGPQTRLLDAAPHGRDISPAAAAVALLETWAIDATSRGVELLVHDAGGLAAAARWSTGRGVTVMNRTAATAGEPLLHPWHTEVQRWLITTVLHGVSTPTEAALRVEQVLDKAPANQSLNDVSDTTGSAPRSASVPSITAAEEAALSDLFTFVGLRQRAQDPAQSPTLTPARRVAQGA